MGEGWVLFWVGLAAGAAVGFFAARWLVRRDFRAVAALATYAELVELARASVAPRNFTSGALTAAAVDEIVRREVEKESA